MESVNHITGVYISVSVLTVLCQPRISCRQANKILSWWLDKLQLCAVPWIASLHLRHKPLASLRNHTCKRRCWYRYSAIRGPRRFPSGAPEGTGRSIGTFPLSNGRTEIVSRQSDSGIPKWQNLENVRRWWSPGPLTSVPNMRSISLLSLFTMTRLILSYRTGTENLAA